MAGRTSNLDKVVSTDRAAVGPQPDNTPATGGTPTGGGGGGPPTGPAGGDLSGTYPNPTISAAKVAAIEAASYPGLGKIPPSSPSNAINWSKRYFVEDYGTLQLAFTAACGGNGILFLPPGVTNLPAGGLLLPSNYTGTVTIQGCGINVSVLSGADGIQFISAGASVPTINLMDFSVAVGGIVIDFNGASYDDQGGGTAGCMKNIAVTGTLAYASTTSAVYLRYVPQFTIENLNGVGPAIAGGGPTVSTSGITIDSCSNLQLTDSTFFTYGKALNGGLSTAGGAAGWQVTNFRAVNCKWGIYCVWAANQGAFFTNVMVDNGNTGINIAGTVPIFMQGGTANACNIVGGEILLAPVSGAFCAIQLYDMQSVAISGMDFTFVNTTGVGACMIYMSNGTAGCVVTACTPGAGGGALVNVDATSTYNRALGNGMVIGSGTASFINSGGGTNSLVS